MEPSVPRVLTIGTFDIPHAGHINFLQQCEALGKLIVGVNSDDFVKGYKKRAPVFMADERRSLLENIGYRTALNDSAGRELIDLARPDILAIGSDWATRDYYKQINVTQDWLDRRDISVIYIPYTTGISTSEIKERLRVIR